MFKHLVASAALAFTLAGPAATFNAAAQDADLSQVSMAVNAAQAAGLADQLTSGDAVTVFVPTNAALEGLPTEALAGVRGDLDKLKQVITYYAVPGTVMAKDVMDMTKDGESKVKTLGGSELTLMQSDSKVMVKGATGEATVTATDIKLGNVTVHVIDGAILPDGVTADAESQ